MIPKKLKSRDMIGMKVKTTRMLRNRAGACVPSGTIVNIANFGRCFDISTEKCPHCGLSAYISGVTREDVELILDENKRLTNAGTKEAQPNTTIQAITNKLTEYENLEERNLLIKLPCGLSDTVYDVVFCDDGKWRIFEMKVCSIVPFGQTKKGQTWNVYLESTDGKAYRSFYDFGRSVFLTEEEAKAALKKESEKEAKV